MSFTDELIASAKDYWDKYYEHPFIQGMINGDLGKDQFLRYLIQDSKYLVEYARVYATVFIKCPDVDIMRHLYSDMGLISSTEDMMHIQYLKDLGYSEKMAFDSPVLRQNKEYTDFMLKVATEGSVAEGVVSVLPCAFSYYDIGKYALAEAKKRGTIETSYFNNWFITYADDSYKAIYDSAYTLCEDVTKDIKEEEKPRLFEIFRESCEHELDFWDMGYYG